MAQWLRDMSVGEWYQAGTEPFEIVGLDSKAEIVLLQNFDGSLEEMDFDAWTQLSARRVPPPEDYSGALDIEHDDYGLEREMSGPPSEHWDNPADLLDSRHL